MSQNNFIINLLASLKKRQSKKQLETDAKNLGDIKVPLVGTLNKAKTKKQIKQDLASLNGAVNLKGKINKREIITSLKQATQQAQKQASTQPIEVSFSIKKEKLINDMKLLAQQNTKLFKSKEMTVKYNNLLNNAKLAGSTHELKNLRMQLGAFKSELKATGNAGLTFIDTLKKGMSRVIQLFGSYNIIMQFNKLLHNAWTEAKTLDGSLVNLQKVTNEIADRDSLYKYFDKAMNRAQELNVEVNSLIYAITEFKKLGWSLSDSELGASWATVLSNVGDMDIDTAISSIKTSISSFDKIGGYTDSQMDKKLEAYTDLINNMSNKYSIDAQGLSEAIRLSAGTLTEAHMSIEQAATMFSTANKYYNDPSYLGNTAKIGSLRMRASTGDKNAVEELQEMGEEIDDLSIASSKLREKLLALTGVDIMEDDHTFKSYYDQLYEIGQVIDQLDDTSRANVLETLFGKSRSAAGAAILSGMKESANAYKDAINSTGSATEEYKKWMESADAASQRLSNNLIKTYQSIINGNTVRDISNLGSSILEFANSLGIIEGTLKGLLTLGILKGVTALTIGIKNSVVQAGNFGTALDAMKKMSTLERDTVKYTNAMKTLTTASAGLSETQLKQVLASDALNASQRISILRANGLTEAEAQAKLAQMGLTQSTQAQIVANGAATASTFSLKAAVTGLGRSLKLAFMSNPIGMTIMGISMAVGLATSVMSKHKNKLEEIKEAAEEAKSAIDEIKSNFDALSSSTNNIKKRFAELAQSVDNLGKTNQSRGKLSTEDYNEFLDLSNQLAELFPQLRIGFDDNGNSILDLSGNVDTIVGSLNNLLSAEQKLASQQILEKMPEVWGKYTSDLENYNKKIKDAESKVSEYKNALEDFSAKYDNGTKTWSLQGDPQQDKELYKHQNSFITALKKINVDYHDVYDFDVEDEGFWENITWDFSKLSDVQISEFKNALATLASEYENSIMLTKDKITAADSGMSSYINTWLSTDFGAMLQLEKMSPDLQNVVKDVLLDSTNWIEVIPKKIKPGDWEAVSDWLENEFLYAIAQIDDDKIQTALADAFNGNFSVDYLQGIIDELIGTKGFKEDNPIIVYLQAKINDKTEKVNAVKAGVTSDLSEEELEEKINSLSEEDLEIAANISVTDDTRLSWDELIAKIEETKEQIKKNSITSFEDVFNASDFVDTKKELLDLAKSGEITSSVLE